MLQVIKYWGRTQHQIKARSSYCFPPFTHSRYTCRTPSSVLHSPYVSAS